MLTNVPPLSHIWYHKDYDGVVAAAMVASAGVRLPKFIAVQYHPELRWTERPLPPGSGIVDFMYHPDAELWIDHHTTSFANKAHQSAFRPDSLHVFEPDAPSCPSIIKKLSWFDDAARWAPYLKWSDIIDSAAYDSPAQSGDLDNPHILLSYLISATADPSILRSLILGICEHSIEEVLAEPTHARAVERVRLEELAVRTQLWERVRLDGAVAQLDQSDLPISYRRYLPYQRFPNARYGIGCYQGVQSVVVSVGENPWAAPGPVHLGRLCQSFGGGGRKATAGVPVKNAVQARALVAVLRDRLNAALQVEVSDPRLRLATT